MPESLSPTIDTFLNMLAVEKGLARNTLEAYSRDLNRLANFLAANGVESWPDGHGSQLRTYFSSLRETGLSVRSITRNLVALRQFYRFLEKERVIQENPVPRLLLPVESRRLPTTLAHDDVVRLLNQPNPSTLLGLRDRAMLEFLYATGLRVS